MFAVLVAVAVVVSLAVLVSEAGRARAVTVDLLASTRERGE